MIKVETTIGNQKITLEVKDMKSVHKFNSTYGSLPQKCDACGSDNVYLSHKSPKNYDYYVFECGDCSASANFGQLQGSQNLFWKDEKMTVYQGDGQGQYPGQQQPPQQQAPPQQAPPPQDDDSDDLPF